MDLLTRCKTQQSEMTRQKHPIGIFAGKLRRFFIVHFNKGYVSRQLRVRQGECHQCGTCCHFSIACPMLTKDKLCLVYGRCRPLACRLFPIDQRDINDVTLCGGVCGYRFDVSRHDAPQGKPSAH